MPSDKDPNKIEVGHGKAGSGSITITSLTFQGGGSGGAGTVGGGGGSSSSQITLDESIYLSGETVQQHVDGITTVSPYLPNRLGETDQPDSQNPVNPSEPNNPFTRGQFWDSANGALTAELINASSTIISAVFFPADRGILVAAFEPAGGSNNPVAALNLDEIFVEGEPDATQIPSRKQGQNDYTAGSISSASVDGITQNINLVDRRPRSDSYPSTNYDSYDQDFMPHQIATAEITVPFDPGVNGDFVIRHFEEEADYFSWKGNDPFSEYASKQIGSFPTYYDDDTSTSVTINSFDMDLVNPAPSSTSDLKALSGVWYYEGTGDYDAAWDIDGLFNNSWVGDGIDIRWEGPDPSNPSEKEPLKDYNSISSFAAGDPQPGTRATRSLSDATLSIQGKITRGDVPVLFATDPFDRTDAQRPSPNGNPPQENNRILYSYDSGGYDPGRDKFHEYFDKEDHRYSPIKLSSPTPENIEEVNSPSSLSYPNEDLEQRALQVRGAYEDDLTDEFIQVLQDNGRSFAAEGGVLAYPTIDYTTDHYPKLTNVSPSQPDHSGVSGSNRFYIRALATKGSHKDGQIRITGNINNPDIPNYFEAFRYEEGDSYEGHSWGLRIEIAPGGVSGQDWLDLGKSHLREDGALKDYTIQDDGYSVLVDYRLDNYTEENSNGEYPLALKITAYANSEFTNNSFPLHHIQTFDS